MDEEDSFYAILRATPRKGDHTANGRRQRELRAPSATDRRRMNADEIKNKQLKLNVTPSFHSWLGSTATLHDESATVFVEIACRERATRLALAKNGAS